MICGFSSQVEVGFLLLLTEALYALKRVQSLCTLANPGHVANRIAALERLQDCNQKLVEI